MPTAKSRASTLHGPIPRTYRRLPEGPVILLTGGSGYIGGRLIPLLEQQPVILRCLARTPRRCGPVCRPAPRSCRVTCWPRLLWIEALQGVQTPTTSST